MNMKKMHVMSLNVTPHLSGWLSLKKEKKCWWGRGDMEPSCIAGGDVKWCGGCGNHGSFFRKWNRITVWPGNSPSRYMPSTVENKDSATSQQHYSRWSKVEMTHVSVPRRTEDKMWYTYSVEYCPAPKRNNLLIPATTWMNFENILLNERSQTP